MGDKAPRAEGANKLDETPRALPIRVGDSGLVGLLDNTLVNKLAARDDAARDMLPLTSAGAATKLDNIDVVCNALALLTGALVFTTAVSVFSIDVRIFVRCATAAAESAPVAAAAVVNTVVSAPTNCPTWFNDPPCCANARLANALSATPCRADGVETSGVVTVTLTVVVVEAPHTSETITVTVRGSPPGKTVPNVLEGCARRNTCDTV